MTEPVNMRIRYAYTLLEVLITAAIIALLLSVLLPAVTSSRKHSRTTHCLARLKEIGLGTSAYANSFNDLVPPGRLMWSWHPFTNAKRLWPYGWGELLYEFVHRAESVTDQAYFPAHRNFQDRYARYFNCAEAKQQVNHAGHYRAYLPFWNIEAFSVDKYGRFQSVATPPWTSHATRWKASGPILGDSHENSDHGDYNPPYGSSSNTLQAETSVIEPGEANEVRKGANRFADRHKGGANYLFGDYHAERNTTLAQRLGCDWDLNGVIDPKPEQMKACGCKSD